MRRSVTFLSILALSFLISCGNGAGPIGIQKTLTAELQFDSTLENFGNQLLEAEITRKLTVRNVGFADATQMTSNFNLSAGFSFVGGTYPGTEGNCTDKLAPQKQCTVNIQFQPKINDKFEEVLRLNCFNNVQTVVTQTPVLNGKGIWGDSGTADVTFNKVGTLYFDKASARALAKNADGKLIVAGQVNSDWVVSQFETNGVLDSSFGTNGHQIVSLGGPGELKAVAVQYDGKIVLVGAVDSEIQLVRVTAAGVLDSSFGNAGKVKTSLTGAKAIATSLIFQPDRSLSVGGYVDNGTDLDPVVIRYQPNGSLDSQFGNQGVARLEDATVNEKFNAIAFSDGKIVGVGSSGSDLLAARFSSSGNLDTGFGQSGKTLVDISGATEVAYAVEVVTGKYVIGGSIQTSSHDSVVLRLDSSGNLDQTFGTQSRVITSLSAFDDWTRGLLIQPDKKILAWGPVSNGSGQRQLGVIRILADGSRDPSFEVVRNLPGSSDDDPKALVMRTNGKIVVAGVSDIAGVLTAFIHRMWP